jgi:hypothetical protein
MLKLLLVVALLISAFNAQTEVLIYQARTSVKRIGDGYEGSASFQEFLIWNLDDNHLSQIIFAKSGSEKFYSLTDGTPFVVGLDGSRGRQYTTFSWAGGGAGRHTMEFNRGQNVNLMISSEGTWFFPGTFKGSGHVLNTGTASRLTDYSRTAVFSEKRTKAANDSHQTEDEAVAGLMSELQLKGYINPDAAVAAASAPSGQTATNRAHRLPAYEHLFRATGHVGN